MNTFRIRDGFSVLKTFVTGDMVPATHDHSPAPVTTRSRARDGTDCDERTAISSDRVVHDGFTVCGVFTGGDSVILTDAEVISNFAKLEATDAASQSALDALHGKITAPAQ
jgi:hypothetical protein